MSSRLYLSLRLSLILFIIPASGTAETDTFKIGWIGSLTGELQKYGAGTAALLAAEDINAEGGILGQRLELIQEDTQGKSRNAISAFRKLRDINRVKFIVGGHSSPETLPIAPLTRGEDILIVAAITSTPFFTNISPHALRLTQTNVAAGILMARHAFEARGFRRAAVISEETNYALPVAEKFRETFLSKGGEIVLFETYLSGEKDFRSLAAKIKGVNPDVVYLGTQSHDVTVNFARQIREIGIRKPLYGNEQMGNALVSPELEGAFEGTIFAEPPFDTERTKTRDFIRRYKERFGESTLPSGLWTAEAYDAVGILAAAINRCGNDVEKVRACLVSGEIYRGVSGDISIGPDGDGTRQFVLKRIERDGMQSQVEFQ